jgi:hypothetical protein
MQVRDFVWGLFLAITNPGEDRLNLTSLHVHFFEKERCVMHAEGLNRLPIEQKSHGLGAGVKLEYVCLLYPRPTGP